MSYPTTRIDTPPANIAQNAHVVLMLNFVAPNLIAVCHEFAKRVGRLTILSSVAMESNRQWDVDWGTLDVVVQKTKTITRNPKHPGGYREVNYIHIPLDTSSQLKRLQPDVIVSLEMGARSALSSIYQRRHPQCGHVVAVFASQRSEAGRGRFRRFVRRRLLPRADVVTYNGPSCRRLLLDLGADEDQLAPWDYAADPRKPYRGELTETANPGPLTLLTVGQLSERKGVLIAVEQLSAWCDANSSFSIEWDLLGTGPLESTIRRMPVPQSLKMNLHGHCDHDTIRRHYRDSDLLFFPTLSDEWGLVVDEALFSGLPVIGSCYSQAAATLIRDEVNGLVYDPEVDGSLAEVLSRYVSLPNDRIHQMRCTARESVQNRTPDTSADQLLNAISRAIQKRRHLKDDRSDR